MFVGGYSLDGGEIFRLDHGRAILRSMVFKVFDESHLAAARCALIRFIAQQEHVLAPRLSIIQASAMMVNCCICVLVAHSTATRFSYCVR